MTGNHLEELKIQKRSRFLMILEWERKRSEESNKHKNILIALVARVMQKALISRETNIAVVKFLKDRALGVINQSEALKTEISYLPDPNIPRINFSLTSGLSAVSEYHTQIGLLLIKHKEKIE
jgi:hypothetical protein